MAPPQRRRRGSRHQRRGRPRCVRRWPSSTDRGQPLPSPSRSAHWRRTVKCGRRDTSSIPVPTDRRPLVSLGHDSVSLVGVGSWPGSPVACMRGPSTTLGSPAILGSPHEPPASGGLDQWSGLGTPAGGRRSRRTTGPFGGTSRDVTAPAHTGTEERCPDRLDVLLHERPPRPAVRVPGDSDLRGPPAGDDPGDAGGQRAEVVGVDAVGVLQAEAAHAGGARMVELVGAFGAASFRAAPYCLVWPLGLAQD